MDSRFHILPPQSFNPFSGFLTGEKFCETTNQKQRQAATNLNIQISQQQNFLHNALQRPTKYPTKCPTYIKKKRFHNSHDIEE